jgi:Zn-dependent protease with chaperone function
MTQDQFVRALRLPSIPTLSLYAATLVAEAPVVFARMLLMLSVAVLLLLSRGESVSGAEAYVELALIPTAWSILALLTPFGGGWWWAQNLGGREPSEREEAAYHDAMQLLQANAEEPLRLPSSWFVLDEHQPDAAVCGSTLMLSRGLLESEYLPAVLAHELGHLDTSDGKLTAALNRLVINPLPRTREKQPKQRDVIVVGGERFLLGITLFGAFLWTGRLLVRFAQGGLGLRITGAFWGSYWREREYTADQYAARLGQAEELADFLEVHALIHDHPVPLIWLTEHTHPPAELRIDRLRKTGPGPAAEPSPAPPAPSGPSQAPQAETP